MDTGKFLEKDAKSLKQSVRKDGYWVFFRKNVKKQFTNISKKLVVSELGCGTGENAILSNKFLKDFIKKYNAIDGSLEMLDFLKKENIKFVKIINLNLDNKINLPKSDVFFTKFLFHHIRNKFDLLVSMKKSINENGNIIIIDKFVRFKKFGLFLEIFFDLLRIRKIFGKHFHISYKKFKKKIKEAGFVIVEEKIKNGKKFYNFFFKKVFLVLKKV